MSCCVLYNIVRHIPHYLYSISLLISGSNIDDINCHPFFKLEFNFIYQSVNKSTQTILTHRCDPHINHKLLTKIRTFTVNFFSHIEIRRFGLNVVLRYWSCEGYSLKTTIFLYQFYLCAYLNCFPCIVCLLQNWQPAVICSRLHYSIIRQVLYLFSYHVIEIHGIFAEYNPHVLIHKYGQNLLI